MMRFLFFAFVLALLVSSCRSGQKFSSDDYPLHVGDIAPDPALDDSAFIVCRENYIPQYYSIKSGFEGEKIKLEAELRKRFSKNQTRLHLARSRELYQSGRHRTDPYDQPMDRIYLVDIEREMAR